MARKRGASEPDEPSPSGDRDDPGRPEASSSKPAKKPRKPRKRPDGAYKLAKRTAADAVEVPLAERDDAQLFLRDVRPGEVRGGLAFEAATEDTAIEPAALLHAVADQAGSANATDVDSDAAVAAQLRGPAPAPRPVISSASDDDGESDDGDGDLGGVAINMIDDSVMDLDGIDEVDAVFEDAKLPSQAELEILASVEAASDLMGAKNASGRRYWVEPDLAHTCTLCGEVGHSRKACKHTQVR